MGLVAVVARVGVYLALYAVFRSFVYFLPFRGLGAYLGGYGACRL